MVISLASAIFWIAVACCTIAQFAIIRSIIVTRPTSDERSLPLSNRFMEIAWSVLPGVALALVFIKTWQAMR